MRLAAFADGEHIRPAIVAEDRLVPLPDRIAKDLTTVVAEWPEHEERLREFLGPAHSHPGIPAATARVALPFRPRRILATGANYSDHLREMAAATPAEPSAFQKLPGSALGPDAPLALGPDERYVDYEGEIALVIGRPVRDVGSGTAANAIAGLMLANDISARDVTMAHTVLSKGRRGFCPLGPMLVTADEVVFDDLGFTVHVNGELRQTATTSAMVHSFAEIVASFSRAVPLLPGDVILTGTPAGVGIGRTPPQFLRPGDEVVVASPVLGTLRTPVIRAGGEETLL